MLQYSLPHPLVILDHPMSKESFKKLVKSKVIDFWECKLRAEASLLPSLKYFHPQYQSLKYPHWLWLTAGENTYEVSKARIQLLFLSSQYPCGKLTRHWSTDNPNGYCQYPFCYDEGLVETPEHILLHCPAYVKTRQSLLPLFLKIQHPISHSLALSLLTSGPTTFLQFLMDCSSLPEVI